MLRDEHFHSVAEFGVVDAPARVPHDLKAVDAAHKDNRLCGLDSLSQELQNVVKVADVFLGK